MGKPPTFQGFALGKGHPEEGSEGNCCDRGTPGCSGWGCSTDLQSLAHEEQSDPPPLGAQLGLPMELLLFCRAAGLQNQPGKLLWERFCTSAPAAARRFGVHSLGLSQSCRFVLGPEKAELCFRQLWVGGWLWGGHSSLDGSPIPGHSSVAPEGARSGRVPAALAKLGTAKAFLSGGGLELKPASFSLPKHLLSCTIPFPLLCSISGHRNV